MKANSRRLEKLENRTPALASPERTVADPMPRIVSHVDEHGGRLPGESWAMALARIEGVTVTDLRQHIRERARHP